MFGVADADATGQIGENRTEGLADSFLGSRGHPHFSASDDSFDPRTIGRASNSLDRIRTNSATEMIPRFPTTPIGWIRSKSLGEPSVRNVNGQPYSTPNTQIPGPKA